MDRWDTACRYAGTGGELSGEAFSYTAWASTQPNNPVGGENSLAFYSDGPIRAAKWGDFASNQSSHFGYAIEWNTDPGAAVPEPASMALLLPCLAVCAFVRGRKSA